MARTVPVWHKCLHLLYNLQIMFAFCWDHEHRVGMGCVHSASTPKNGHLLTLRYSYCSRILLHSFLVQMLQLWLDAPYTLSANSAQIHCSPIRSCVLKGSTVQGWLIPSINITWSTSQLVLSQHMINISVNGQLQIIKFLHTHHQVMIDKYELVDTQPTGQLLIGCWSSVDQVSIMIWIE